jgi:hypothetical protein
MGRAFSPAAAALEANPLPPLEQVIAPYRALYAKFKLSGFLQVVDWLDRHSREILLHPAVIHQDFHANNVLVGLGSRSRSSIGPSLTCLIFASTCAGPCLS